MAKQQYYIGSTGPFYYDDGDTYKGGEGAGESQTAFYSLSTAPTIFGSVKCISSITIGNNVDGADPFIQALGHANDSIIYWMEDEDYWKFIDDIFISDGENIILGTSTGTKIGTATSQKLAFYNANPVDQPDTVSDAVTQDLTGTDTVDKTKLEADLTSCKNAINNIINRLQELGLIA